MKPTAVKITILLTAATAAGGLGVLITGLGVGYTLFNGDINFLDDEARTIQHFGDIVKEIALNHTGIEVDATALVIDAYIDPLARVIEASFKATEAALKGQQTALKQGVIAGVTTLLATIAASIVTSASPHLPGAIAATGHGIAAGAGFVIALFAAWATQALEGIQRWLETFAKQSAASGANKVGQGTALEQGYVGTKFVKKQATTSETVASQWHKSLDYSGYQTRLLQEVVLRSCPLRRRKPL